MKWSLIGGQGCREDWHTFRFSVLMKEGYSEGYKVSEQVTFVIEAMIMASNTCTASRKDLLLLGEIESYSMSLHQVTIQHNWTT